MTDDELKFMPKGHFIVMKTGCRPMKTRLQLFFKWESNSRMLIRFPRNLSARYNTLMVRRLSRQHQRSLCQNTSQLSSRKSMMKKKYKFQKQERDR